MILLGCIRVLYWHPLTIVTFIVVAVLAARAPGPHFVEPERRLTFTRNNPMISIGRASKVSSKGFVAAADNAWFDSPVMSRGHAELTVDFNTTPKVAFLQLYQGSFLA